MSHSEARRNRSSKELNPEERRYLDVLEGIKKEVVEGVPVDLGRTKVETHAEWVKEVKQAGEAFKKRPTIAVAGHISGTPSGMNNYRWRVSVRAINISHHPTEAELEVLMFGISEKENTIYLLAEQRKKLELRRTHVMEVDIYSLPKPSYYGLVAKLDKGETSSAKPSKKDRYSKKNPPGVEMRGWVINVRHNGEVVASAASQDYLYRHMSEISGMAKVVGKK